MVVRCSYVLTAALSLLLILFYPLSEKRMEGVNEQLTQLRKTGNHD